MMTWITIVAWAVPFFFVLGAAWFGVRLGQEFWAGAWRVCAWVASRQWWARFWRSRRAEGLMRFSVFRRWVP